MGTTRYPAVPVMVVRTNGSVGWRMGETSTTPGLFIVADCPACHDIVSAARHAHRQWRVQTYSGYLVGDLSLASRREAQAAATALGPPRHRLARSAARRTARPGSSRSGALGARPVEAGTCRGVRQEGIPL